MRTRNKKRLEHKAARMEIASSDLSDMHEALCEQERELEEIVKLVDKLKDAYLSKRVRKVSNLLSSASGEIMVFGEELSDESEELLQELN